jgi:4-amino-4-deoxy-L-arabinose transferase-like glycosyltransferase
VTIVAVLVGAALTVPFRHLWDPDESRYAEVTREMLAAGQMLVPMLDGAPYPHKPPLYFWTEAALRACGASWTAAAVLPPLAAFLAVLLLLPRMALRLGLEPGAGALASAMLAASPLAAGLALGGRMDMLLALSHTLALYFLARLLGFGGPPAPGAGAHLAFWACVAAGVLTKGPVSLALPLLAAVTAWAVVLPQPRLRPVLLGWGPPMALAIVALWLVPAGIAGGHGYLREILVSQTAERIVASPYAHPQPFYFHLLTYPFTGLPWSPVVIVAAAHALRRRRCEAATFLALACVSLLLLFTAVGGKLVVYLLPMFPAALLLAADAVLRGLRGVRPAVIVGSGLMTVVGAVFALSPRFRIELAAEPWLVFAGGVAIAIPALLALVRAVRSATVGLRQIAPLVAAGAAFAAVTLPVATHALDPFMSVQGIARSVAEIEPGEAAGLVYGESYPGLSLYAGRSFTVVVTPEALHSALEAGRCVVIAEKDLRRIPGSLRPPTIETMRILHRRRVILLVRGAEKG